MVNEMECAVLVAPGHTHWAAAWLARHRGSSRRLRVTAIALPAASSRDSAIQALSPPTVPPPAALVEIQAHLCRFQVCLLPIDAGNLSWTRTALSCAQHRLRLPTLGLVDALRAEAIGDLLGLGMSDFMTTAADGEECRARCVQAVRLAARRTLDSLRVPSRGVADLRGAYGLVGRIDDAHVPAASVAPWEVPGGLPLPGPGAHEGGGDDLPGTDFKPDHAMSETAFKQAKARVIARFESQYLDAALRRHGGNVARAARACAKHRRAFWALMRKHGIRADTYRRGDYAPRTYPR